MRPCRPLIQLLSSNMGQLWQSPRCGHWSAQLALLFPHTHTHTKQIYYTVKRGRHALSHPPCTHPWYSVWLWQSLQTLQASSAYLLAAAEHQCIRRCNRVALNPSYTVKGVCSKINIFLEIVLTLWHKYTLQCPMNSTCRCTEGTKNMSYKAEIKGNSLRKIQKEGHDSYFCILTLDSCVSKGLI